MFKPLALALLLSSLAMTANAQDTAPAGADTFEREMLAALKAAHAAKKSVYLHLGGRTVAGAIKAIGPDSVILSNREHATIIIRRERIDAIEAD